MFSKLISDVDVIEAYSFSIQDIPFGTHRGFWSKSGKVIFSMLETSTADESHIDLYRYLESKNFTQNEEWFPFLVVAGIIRNNPRRSNFIFTPTTKNMASSLSKYTDKYFLPDELALSFVKSITEIVLQVSDNSPKIRWGMDEPIPGQIPA